jgi:hypothetical protein
LDGTSWSEGCAPNIWLNAVWGSSATDVFAVGIDAGAGLYGGALIIHYDGSTWSSMHAEEMSGVDSVGGIWGSSPSDVFATAENNDNANNSILHYDGSSWSVMGGGPFPNLIGLWGTSGADVFAVGGRSDGTCAILRFDGLSWSAMPINAPGSLVAVWGSSPGDVFAVGGYTYGDDDSEAGVIFHYGPPE